MSDKDDRPTCECGLPRPDMESIATRYSKRYICPCGRTSELRIEVGSSGDTEQYWITLGPNRSPVTEAFYPAHDADWLDPEHCDCDECGDAPDIPDDQTADAFEPPESVDEVMDDLREAEEQYEELHGTDTPPAHSDHMAYLDGRYGAEPDARPGDRCTSYTWWVGDLILYEMHRFRDGEWLWQVSHDRDGFADTLADACDAADEAAREMLAETREVLG